MLHRITGRAGKCGPRRRLGHRRGAHTQGRRRHPPPLQSPRGPRSIHGRARRRPVRARTRAGPRDPASPAGPGPSRAQRRRLGHPLRGRALRASRNDARDLPGRASAGDLGELGLEPFRRSGRRPCRRFRCVAITPSGPMVAGDSGSRLRRPAARPDRDPLRADLSAKRIPQGSAEHAKDHRDPRLHHRRALRESQGRRPRVAPRLRPPRRLGRLRPRGFRGRSAPSWASRSTPGPCPSSAAARATCRRFTGRDSISKVTARRSPARSSTPPDPPGRSAPRAAGRGIAPHRGRPLGAAEAQLLAAWRGDPPAGPVLATNSP